MSQWNEGEVDFIKRTITILKQYEKIEFNKLKIEDEEKECFETTLFINCLIGLIVTPQQAWNNKLPNTELDDKWYIKKKHILNTGQKQGYKINDIIEGIRNATCHNGVTPISSDLGKIKKITHIHFKNEYENQITFEAKIPVETLKKFTLKFAKDMLRIIEENR